MAEPINEVTIVGGGTAGWLAALMCVTLLNRDPDEPFTGATVIESPNIPTVGVGEATVPAMRELLKLLGIDEALFMARCNASFKLGVRFVDWDVDPRHGHSSYDHPFDGIGIDLRGVNPGHHFHKFGAAEGAGPFGDHLSPSTRLIDNFKAPKQSSQGNYEFTVGHAYHLDARLFSELLKEIAVSRGVMHVLDDVEAVEQDDAGLVTALNLRERGSWPVEFVIDCTGFRDLIMNQALNEPFVSFDRQLLNDRAVAVQIPHTDDVYLEPCTRSTALEAGWSWRVPLYSRVGTGYVFSSAFKTDDEAIDEYLAHLGAAGAGAEPRVIGMRVGRSRRSWVGNCVAVGLSSGFIEPLESTAIFIIEQALRRLVSNMPARDFDPAVRDRFNEEMAEIYDEVLDFVVLHYCTAKRADTPYWQAARSDLEVPEGLQEKLTRWRRVLPVEGDFKTTHLFGYWSYLIVLFAKGYFDDVSFPDNPAVLAQDWAKFCAWVDGEKRKLLTHLPDHRELLTEIRARAPQPAERMPGAELPFQAPRATVSLPGQTLGIDIVRKPPPSTQAGSLL